MCKRRYRDHQAHKLYAEPKLLPEDGYERQMRIHKGMSKRVSRSYDSKVDP